MNELKEESIKTIAKRLKRMTKVGDQTLLHGIFWDDLDVAACFRNESGSLSSVRTGSN